jgi:hypothetical protein
MFYARDLSILIFCKNFCPVCITLRIIILLQITCVFQLAQLIIHVFVALFVCEIHPLSLLVLVSVAVTMCLSSPVWTYVPFLLVILSIGYHSSYCPVDLHYKYWQAPLASHFILKIGNKDLQNVSNTFHICLVPSTINMIHINTEWL